MKASIRQDCPMSWEVSLDLGRDHHGRRVRGTNANRPLVWLDRLTTNGQGSSVYPRIKYGACRGA